MKKQISQLFCLAFILAVFSLSAVAQNAIAPEKRKLIAEIVVVMNMDKQMGQITDVMLTSYEAIHAAGVRQNLDKNPHLTPKERDNIESVMAARSQAFLAKFKERLPAAINYADYIEQAVYPIYDKIFTEKELTDLLAFYKSETGQKMLVSMPGIVAEAMEVGQRVLLPRVTKLVDEIVAEELAGLPPPPPAKRN